MTCWKGGVCLSPAGGWWRGRQHLCNISGGHINPVVAFGALVTGKIGLIKGIMYVVAQLVGAVVGVLLLAAAIPETAQGTLGAHGLATRRSSE